MQTYNWTKYAFCEKTLSGGPQAEAIGFRIFSKHYTLSNIQLNNVCALWKFTECWASSRSNDFQKKFFKTLYIFKHTLKQSMLSVKVTWVVGFKHTQWVSEEYFQSIIHIQTYNWTRYAFCESALSGGPQAEAMSFRKSFLKHNTHSKKQLNNVCALWKFTAWGLQAETMSFRRSFLKHYTHSNIQLNNVCAPRKYSECWTSSRSNGFQKKFFKTFYIFKHTIGQCMRSVKVHWVVGFKQKQWLAEEVFWNIIQMQTYNWTKYALCESTVGVGLQSTSKGSQKKFFETLYTFKHTIEQCMRSVKVNWMMGFKQKQWLAEEYFQNIIHIQKHNWTAYALCEISLRGWLQAEAMAFRRNSSTHYTHWNIKLNKICPLWKYSECWASSTSNVFQTNFFETLYTFKHTLEQSMPSVKYTECGLQAEAMGFSRIFQNIIHIQTYNWTMYALCKSTLSGGLQAEAMGSTRIFLKHYTHANVQLNKVCALRKYTDCLASSRRNGFQKKFFKTFYIFKRTIKQIMHSLKVQWVLGFKHKQRVSEEIFWNIIHIQTCNWTKVSDLWKYTEWWASSRSNG